MDSRPRNSEFWPLAPNQVAVHLADISANHAGLHSVAVAYQLTGVWESEQLENRFLGWIRGHPILSACVLERDGDLLMGPSGHLASWHVEDIPLDADAPEVARLRLRECRRAVDPSLGPMIRAVLLRYRGGVADLVIVASHLVVDEHSVEIIVAGLLGDGSAGTSAPGNYERWAAAARDAVNSADAETRAAHLRYELSVPAPMLEWGAGDAAVAGTDGARVPFELAGEAWRRLTAEARKKGVTPYSVLLAAVGLVWARDGGVPAVLVGATVNRRPVREIGTVGYFNSTVAVPVRPDDGQTVGDYLRAVHERSLRAYRDADLPLFATLPPSQADHAPHPQVAVVPCRPLPIVDLPGKRAVPYPDADLGVSQFPMTCYVDLDSTDGPRGFLQFQRRWFTPDTARLFARQVVAVVEECAAGLDTLFNEVTALGPQDTANVMSAARGSALPSDTDSADATITGVFARRAFEAPDRIAVTDLNSVLRYRDLDTRSAALAQSLVEAGVAPGGRVGVRMKRSGELVIALLAVLKAGAAYVPLDPDYPEARLAFIAEDTELSAIICDAGTDTADSVPRCRDVPLMCSNAVPGNSDTPLPLPDPDAVAYVIHTSGSTGQPKGVSVTHRNVLSLVKATRDELALRPSDVWTQFHSFAFDFSVWEIWGCLLTGGRLVVVPYWVSRNPEEFHSLLEDEEVTILSQTPTAFAQLIAADRMAHGHLSVRLLIFGGEPLDQRMLLPWFDRYPSTRAENMYGITETTVHCTRHTITRGDALAGSRSVGRPLPGWELYLLDSAGRLVAPGVPGEIYVGGVGVAHGYLGRPELTAERFAKRRLTERLSARLYRSGDRGRYLSDGNIEHLGRLDSQVKIRGFRIELGEVRNALLAVSGVRSAAVVVRKAQTPEARLDAYVVLAEDYDAGAVRRQVAERLPAHMVPATVTAIPELPLTSNGKLDAARLPEPIWNATGRDSKPAEFWQGRDDLAITVAALWEKILSVPVGIDDNFFDLGGNSLLAVRMSTALRDAGLPAIALREIFRHATPTRIARLLRSRAETAGESA
jgi:amino acid adenylation domain-containing protein